MFNGENKTKKGEKRERKKKNQFPKIPNWILFCFVSFFFFILGAKGGERDIDDFASKSCWILDVVKGSLLLLSPPFHRHVDSVNGPGQQKNKKKTLEWIGSSAHWYVECTADSCACFTEYKCPTANATAFAVTPTYQMDLWPLSIVQVT